MTCARLVIGCVAVASSAGCFLFERGSDLAPGEIDGRAVFDDDGKPGAFATIKPEGAGLIRRADESGHFRVQGMQAGAFVLRITSDEDGDGVAERGAVRGLQLTPYSKDGATTLPSILLGDVRLKGTGTVSGFVVDGEDAARPVVPAAKVLVVRDSADVPAELGATFAAGSDLGAEASTATDDTGAFSIAGLIPGRVKILAFVGGGTALKASGPIPVDVVPGPDNEVGDVEVRFVDDSRSVQIGLSFEGPPAGVDVFQDVAGLAPDLGSRDAHAEPGAQIHLDVPFGIWDVRGVDENGERKGVLLAQVSYPDEGGLSALTWGLMLVKQGDPCGQPQGDERVDLDGDGVRSFPNPAFDDAPWLACAGACADAFGARAGSPRCEVGDETYDCDDDGDLQSDVTEPYACFGLCGGTDLDGDGICDLADPLPQCPGDDPSAERCQQPPTFVLPDVRPEYQEAVVDDAGTSDAGAISDAGADAGVVVVDSGVVVDAGADAGAVALDSGVVVDAGADAGVIVVDAGPPPPPAAFLVTSHGVIDPMYSNFDRATEVVAFGDAIWAAGRYSEDLDFGGACSHGPPYGVDDTGSFLMQLDDRGTCTRFAAVEPVPHDGGAGTTVSVDTTGLARLSSGALVLTGTFDGDIDFGTPSGGGPNVTLTTSVEEGFIAIFDASLKPLRAIRIGDGNGTTSVDAVTAVDPGGFAAAGTFGGTLALGGSTTPMTTTNVSDLWFARFDSGGNAVVAGRAEQNGVDADVRAMSAAFDGAGSFYVGGSLYDTTLFSAANLVNGAGGYLGGWYARIDGASASVEWAHALLSINGVYLDALDATSTTLALGATVTDTATIPTSVGNVDPPPPGNGYYGLVVLVDPASGLVGRTEDVVPLDPVFAPNGSRIGDVELLTGGDVLVTGTQEYALVGFGFDPLDEGPNAFALRLHHLNVGSTWQTTWMTSARTANNLRASGAESNGYGVASLTDGSPVVVGELSSLNRFHDLFGDTAVNPDNYINYDAFVWRLLADGSSALAPTVCTTSGQCGAGQVCDPRTALCVADCALYGSFACDGTDGCDVRTGLCGPACGQGICGSGVCSSTSQVCIPSCAGRVEMCRGDAPCCDVDGQCGDMGTPPLLDDDTVTYDGATYSVSAIVPAPFPRERAAMSDTIGGPVVLYGGYDANQQAYLYDTWEWDGAAWTAIPTTQNYPPQQTVDMAMSSAGDVGVVLLGGTDSSGTPIDLTPLYDPAVDDWVYNYFGTSPRRLEPAAVHDIAFGGIDPATYLPTGQTLETTNPDAWYFQVTTFAGAPQARTDARLAYDPIRSVIVMVGGRDNYGHVLTDVWELDVAMRTWTPMTVGVPPARADAVLVWDGANVVLMGGRDAAGAYRGEVFRYDGPTLGFTQLPTSVERRAGARAAFDGTRAVVFGGRVEANAPVCGVGGSGSPPPGWTCATSSFADGQCHCGCGIPDADCAVPGSVCQSGCPTGAIASNDDTRCRSITCGDGIVDWPEYCDDALDPNCDMTTCKHVVPLAWTCAPSLFEDRGACTCGCGAVDGDCNDALSSSCGSCGDVGSCAAAGGCGFIDPTNNAICQ